MKVPTRRQRGFTLIELMVTLAIGSILMLVAVPSLTTYRRNAELTSATNTLLAAINAARSEAMKRGTSAMVVPTNNGTNWNSGWVVFSLGATNTTQAYNSAIDKTVHVQSALPTYINVVGNQSAAASPPYMMFDASGYSKLKSGGFGALTLTLTRTDVNASSTPNETRRIVIASTGRARTCKPTSASDANCAANSTQ
jgi:type IV fimbrial biogenesis protein FimT